MAHRITLKEIRAVLSLMAPPRIRTSGRRLPRGPFRDAAVAWYTAYEDFTDRGRGMMCWTRLGCRVSDASRNSREVSAGNREQ
jgi:hypothetical protein